MEVVNLLHLSSRSELRHWLEENHCKEKCCWVVTYRSKCPPGWPAIPYIDVVEEALCFGWIDSTLKRLPDAETACAIPVVLQWSVGSAPLSSPPQKPLDSAEHGQMRGS